MKNKVKPNETIGEDLPILTFQVNRIMKNCQYQVDTKNEWVQWVTANVNRTSLKSITQAQAKKIIMAQEGLTLVNEPTENWAFFDKANPKHKLILSLCRQCNWIVNNSKHGEIVDLNRLGNWIKSNKCPVNKPLKKMDSKEIERVIAALSNIVKSIYK
jgi:hypothetical protein